MAGQVGPLAVGPKDGGTKSIGIVHAGILCKALSWPRDDDEEDDDDEGHAFLVVNY